MKRLVDTRTLIPSLALIGASLLSYGSAAAAAPDEGAQGLARALLAPAIRSAAAGTPAGTEERASTADAVQIAQRFLSGAPDVHAGARSSSTARGGDSLRLRLAERRHDGDVNELIRRTILGERA